MHAECLTALQRSLRGIAPRGGIAYLLCRVVPHYWIPVAVSNEVLEKIPYYRLGYAFEFDGVANKKPKKISDEINELVTRGKIETVVFGTSFVQEVIPVGNGDSIFLAIVRSSPDDFEPLSQDASLGVNPLMELIHKTWGEHSFNSLTDDGFGDITVTPSLIAQKAAELLSDKLRFPPYFLLTDYVLSVHSNDGGREEHICSNPLGYTCWIRKKLAENPPPWIGVMAEKIQSYSEDLRDPKELTPEQKESYGHALKIGDVLANQLTDTLRDDVMLVAYVPEGTPENATLKLWARHNRSKANQPIVKSITVQGYKTPAGALRKLLEHDPYENKERPEENDFLIVSWATWNSGQYDWKAIHVSCDTSHRLLLPPDKLFDGSWEKLCLPKDNEYSLPRIEIKFRPVEVGASEATHTAMSRVLDYSYEQLVGLDPKAVINSFWKSVVNKKSGYAELFKVGAVLHKSANWSTVDKAALKPLIQLLIPDLQLIEHLGRWTGFKDYREDYKIIYIHLANGFKEDRIAVELIEFILGKLEPTRREDLEYVNGSGIDVAILLKALFFLRSDAWLLDFAEVREEVQGKSSTRETVFAIELSKTVNKSEFPELVQNAFRDLPDEECEKTGELRSGCTMLRKSAKKFAIIGNLEKEPKISLYFEFVGKKKPR